MGAVGDFFGDVVDTVVGVGEDAFGALTGASEKEAGQELASAQERATAQNIAFQREALEKQEAASQRALAGFEPFVSDTPGAALNQVRAFSGALGSGAQRQAFEGFQDSPGVAFLRERGLRGIDRGAAATGGLGGGRRLQALTEFSQNLAEQSFQSRFGDLKDVANVDLGLQQDISNIETRLGAAQSAGLVGIGQTQGQGTLGAGMARAEGTRNAGRQFQSTLFGLAELGGMALGGGFGPPVVKG